MSQWLRILLQGMVPLMHIEGVLLEAEMERLLGLAILKFFKFNFFIEKQKKMGV